MISSEPTLTGFNPDIIPYHRQVIDLIRADWDYSKGYLEILLSGSVGSAKSTLAAHIIITHCLMYNGARVALCRRALPDIKRTIYLKCLEHISNEMKEGEDYWLNTTSGSITFRNGSEIISISWADKRYQKSRSIDLSAAVFEELVENEGDDTNGYKEIKMRVGRIPKVRESWILCCTNPGSPSSHWYKYFFVDKKETKKIFFSLTEDNPFLPETYIQQLKADLDEKTAERMLYGKWIDIVGETIYHSYGDHNESGKEYSVDLNAPIVWAWDFNIGEGKPMSTVFSQYIGGVKHYFDEIIIEGARTESILEEAANRGILNYNTTFLIRGDSTGTRKDTRNILSDYEIIDNFLLRYVCPDGRRIRFKREVPTVNPPIRQRHNLVNAWCKNALGEVKIFVYPKAKTLREGMRLTKLKNGAEFQEDDTKHYQHCTTALGYDVHFEDLLIKRARTKGVQEI